MRFRWFAILLISVLGAPANSRQEVLTTSTVDFPKSGPILVRAVVKQGDHPRLSFRSERTGEVVLNADVGKPSEWTEPVDKSDPKHLSTSVGFIVLHRQGLPDPLIVALARAQGGSDCSYNSALVGEVSGKLMRLTPDLPDHETRGNVWLSSESPGTTTLTVTSERYLDSDVHYKGPSRMAVSVYRYEPSEGRFVELRGAEVDSTDLHVSGEDVMSLFGAFTNC
jgi:hypothetical protein